MPPKVDNGLALKELDTTAEEEAEKRLNLILSARVYADLAKMAKLRHTTMTEIVRLALGLIKIAIYEASQGNKLVVARANGEVLKELVLPG